MLKRLLFLSLISTNLWGVEFSNLHMKDFNRDIISPKHLRFTNKNIVIHLTQENRSNKQEWKNETLKKEIEVMFNTRKKISNLMGFKEMNFENYNLSKFDNRYDQLKIWGQFKDPSNKTKWFLEDNIYFLKDVIQVKLYSDTEKITDDYLTQTLAQLKLNTLEIQ